MATPSVGFVGGGRVATILLGGWRRANTLPIRVVVAEATPAVLNSLKEAFPFVETVGTDTRSVAAQDIIFVAVHPPAMKDALLPLRTSLGSDSIVVSLAPKLTIAKLKEMLGGFSRVARVIPNAPSIIGRGFNPVAFDGSLSASEKQVLLELIKPLGECPEVPEGHLEGYAILTAMGPTYFWPQIYALKALGESFGMPSDAVLKGLDKMLWGSMATVRDSGLGPEQVMDLIPVKPVAEEIAVLTRAYSDKLKALMEKIKP